MINISGLLAVASAFLIIAAAPGPATLALATTSMRHGRKSGLRFALGLSVGLAFWGLIAATGLGAFLEASRYALTILKVVGGAYLLYLAFGAARASLQITHNETMIETQELGFRSGLLLNLSNSKAVLAWMATLTLGLGHRSDTIEVSIATVVCILIGFIIYIVYALFFSVPGMMGFYAGVKRWVEGIMAGVFAIAGFGLMASVFKRS